MAAVILSLSELFLGTLTSDFQHKCVEIFRDYLWIKTSSTGNLIFKQIFFTL